MAKAKEIKQEAIKEVSVGVDRVINLGNYENVRYSCAVVYTVGLDKGETAEEAYSKALAFCKAKVLAEVERLSK